MGIYDNAYGYTGTFDSWTLNLIGKPNSEDDIYIYTNEYSEATADQAARSTLSDTAGNDTLNAAACTANLVLNLSGGGVSTIDGRSLAITSGTVIENAYGGDGNDSINGNGAANILFGMRGNDTIDGDAGSDTAVFTGVRVNYTISSISGGFTVSSTAEGIDTLKNVEFARFFDQTINLTTFVGDKGPASKDLVFVFKSEKVGVGVNPASYSYFYTVNPDEAAYVRSQASWPWVEKTATFEAAHSNPSSAVPVYRFWSDKHQSHFFTISVAEKAVIIEWSSTGKNGYDWIYEGENFKVYTGSTPTDALGKAAIPVYRAWMDDKDFNPANGQSGGHFFTANEADYDVIVKLVGVVGEGVAFYGEVPGA